MKLVQLVRHEGSVRLPHGERPCFLELPLDEGQVVSLEWRESMSGNFHRKTQDWYWTAWVAHYL